MNNIYVVSTPIGNIQDITLRAIDILKSVNVIYCENTIVSKKFLDKHNIKSKLISLHKFNELSREESIKKNLENGSVAVISDAGTPTLSDPGSLLFSKLKNQGYNLITIPGTSSIVAALSISGINYSSFSFIGFLEKTKEKIIKQIISNLNSDVLVAFESPNRIEKTLNILMNEYGDIKICIARELTKIHEEVKYDVITNLLKINFKGEFIILIPTRNISLSSKLEEYINILKKEKLSEKSIVTILSKITTYKKNDIYKYLK